MNKIDIPYINYIIDIIKDIENSIKNISRNSFEKNKDKIDANVRRIEIMSEAIKNISKKLKDKYSNIEWQKFERLYDMLKNHYFGIDTNAVWKLINEDLPILKKQIKDLNGK